MNAYHQLRIELMGLDSSQDAFVVCERPEEEHESDKTVEKAERSTEPEADPCGGVMEDKKKLLKVQKKKTGASGRLVEQKTKSLKLHVAGNQTLCLVARTRGSYKNITGLLDPPVFLAAVVDTSENSIPAIGGVLFQEEAHVAFSESTWTLHISPWTTKMNDRQCGGQTKFWMAL